MNSSKEIRRLLNSQGTMRTWELSKHGIPRKMLAVLLAKGELLQLGRGVYASPKITDDSRFSLIQAAAVVPKGVLCLLSALRFHGLTTQLSPDIWMALPRGAWRPTQLPLRVKFTVVSPRYWKLEVETHHISKAPIHVYSAAKTIVDCFKFRNKVGVDVAMEALRDFLRKNRGGANALWRIAGEARVRRIMQPYLDASL